MYRVARRSSCEAIGPAQAQFDLAAFTASRVRVTYAVL